MTSAACTPSPSSVRRPAAPSACASWSRRSCWPTRSASTCSASASTIAPTSRSRRPPSCWRPRPSARAGSGSRARSRCSARTTRSASSRIRDARPAVRRARRDHGRSRLFVESFPLAAGAAGRGRVSWSGTHRAALADAGVYPRPLLEPLPVWIAVGGTPRSVVRAGALGLPLALAINGGAPERFAPLVDLYRNAARQAGHDPAALPLGINSHAFVASDPRQAAERFLAQMSVGDLAQGDVMQAIELFGAEVAPAVRAEVTRRRALPR